MSRRHRMIIALITAVLAIQFVVPAIQYFGEGPNRFGWQMYSRENPRPEIVAVTADGDRTPLDLRDFVFALRGELRVSNGVLHELCLRAPETSYFELAYPYSGEERVHQCID